MLKIKNIFKSFGGIIALNNVSLEVNKEEIIGLIGPNGSGKSTLFNIITGFYKKDSGEIYFKEDKIDGLSPNLISKKGICRTFQVSRSPEKLTVLENMFLASSEDFEDTIFYSLFRRKYLYKSKTEKINKIFSILELVGLKDLANEYSGNLSGGQRKLLSLARILIKNPEMILLDEPTAGVNPTLAKEFIKFIKNLQEVEHKTFFIVEHNMRIISEVCNKVYVLDSGKVIAKGTPSEIKNDKRVLDAYLGTAREN